MYDFRVLELPTWVTTEDQQVKRGRGRGGTGEREIDRMRDRSQGNVLRVGSAGTGGDVHGGIRDTLKRLALDLLGHSCR